MRQTIALEARIAAGDLGPARQRRPDRPPTYSEGPDPRLPVVRRILHTATETETDGAAREDLLRDIDERLDDLPETDPNGDLCVDDIILSICIDLGLRPDLSQLPDEILAMTRRGPPCSLAGPADLPRETRAPPRRNGPDPP